MDKRESTISQIYLLSLDTFMIMTVMGITLGIIFFILNPTLNSGVIIYTQKLEFKLENNKFDRARNVLLNRYECDIVETDYCDMNIKNGNELQIVLDRENISFLLVFKLYDKKGVMIEVKSDIQQAIKEIGLTFILKG